MSGAENAGGWGWSGWTSKFTQVAKESLSTAAEATKVYAEATKNLINDIANEAPAETPKVRLPWELPEELKDKEELVKKQVLLLSEEKWSFLNMPQDSELLSDWEYVFDPDLAQELMNVDAKLARMRFLLVPYKVKEDPFWKHYFARVYIIKCTIMDPSVNPKMNQIEEPVPKASSQQQHTTTQIYSPKVSIPAKSLPKEDYKIDDSREEELKKELEALGEDFDLDLEDLDLDDTPVDIDLDLDDPELDLLLNG